MGLRNSFNTSVSVQTTPTDLLRAGTAAGRLPSPMEAVLAADFTLSAASGVQSAFPSTLDVWTLEANTTYRFSGAYYIGCGTTTHTTAMAFALGGGASVQATGGCEYHAILWSAAANTITTTQSTTQVTGVASKVLNATSTAATCTIIFEGIIRMNAGGTVTPQINFSANPGGTNLMKVNSWIRFEPIGDGSVTSTGSSVA